MPRRGKDDATQRQCRSHQPGRHGANGLAEGSTVNVAVDCLRAEELSVVECIEGLQAELQRFRIREFEAPQQRKVEIEFSGSVE